MTMHASPTTVDSIKNSLVALRMPRALEVLDATVARQSGREAADNQDENPVSRLW